MPEVEKTEWVALRGVEEKLHKGQAPIAAAMRRLLKEEE